MKIKAMPILAVAGLICGLLSCSASLYAQDRAASQQPREGGGAANSATANTENSVKHAYRVTMDEASDAALTTKVKAALLTDRMTRKFAIHVDSDQGTVILRGSVDSPTTAVHTQSVVAGVSGVQSVKNQLTWPTSAR